MFTKLMPPVVRIRFPHVGALFCDLNDRLAAVAKRSFLIDESGRGAPGSGDLAVAAVPRVGDSTDVKGVSRDQPSKAGPLHEHAAQLSPSSPSLTRGCSLRA